MAQMIVNSDGAWSTVNYKVETYSYEVPVLNSRFLKARHILFLLIVTFHWFGLFIKIAICFSHVLIS